MMRRLIYLAWASVLLAGPRAWADATIDRTEVSNADYADFMRAHPQRKSPKYWGEYRPVFFTRTAAAKLAPFDRNTFTQPDYPVVGVNWFDARDYCQWRGQRLPTHAEWMQMAGAADGRIWPWGNQWDYQMANSGGERNGEYDGYTYAAPVDSFHAGSSPHGILHMAGNVAEWVEEQWVAGGSSNNSPTGVAIKSVVQREPEYRNFDIGFRCMAR